MPLLAKLIALSRLAGVLAVGGAVGACSGDSQLSGLSVSESGVSGATKSDASAYSASSPSKRVAGGFNPFSGGSQTSVARRVVVENPTLAQVLETGPLAEMSMGRSDAPVTIIKYASLTCPYCRKFHLEVFPKLKRRYIDTGKVRFIIREFPIGRSSGNATIALRCAPASKYSSLYGKFLAQQKTWVSQTVRLDAIHRVAKQFGLSRAQFDACLKNQDMITGLQWVKDRGRSLGVIGTPNFFIQNELVKSVLTYDELSGRIEAILRGPVASSSAPGN